MTQGYITLATKSQDDAQIKQAVALASSLKLHDPVREFCLVVDSFDCVPQKYEDAFELNFSMQRDEKISVTNEIGKGDSKIPFNVFH